jgi:hypothetical protein
MLIRPQRPFRHLAGMVMVIFAIWGVSAASEPVAASSAKAHIIAFGLWGDQSVFASEADKAAHIMAARYGHGGQVIVRANTRQRQGAMIGDLNAAVQALSSGIDRDQDILVLILTSHGSPLGVAVKGGGSDQLLTPDILQAILDRSKIRNRVLIVSACYSGIFADQMADAHTLIVTAADARHPSFGCQDGAIWTYFGDAFFNLAMRQSRTFAQAFNAAKATVMRREKLNGFAFSNPQMRGGQEVLTRLEPKR